MISIFLGVVCFFTFISALRWRMDFYALSVILVKKELPIPSEQEMMELRQFVIKNVIKDFLI